MFCTVWSDQDTEPWRWLTSCGAARPPSLPSRPRHTNGGCKRCSSPASRPPTRSPLGSPRSPRGSAVPAAAVGRWQRILCLRERLRLFPADRSAPAGREGAGGDAVLPYRPAAAGRWLGSGWCSSTCEPTVRAGRGRTENTRLAKRRSV